MTTYKVTTKTWNPTVCVFRQLFFPPIRMGGGIVVGMIVGSECNLTRMYSRRLARGIHAQTSHTVQYHAKLNAKLYRYVTCTNVHPPGENSFYQTYEGFYYHYSKVFTKKERKIFI